MSKEEIVGCGGDASGKALMKGRQVRNSTSMVAGGGGICGEEVLTVAATEEGSV